MTDPRMRVPTRPTQTVTWDGLGLAACSADQLAAVIRNRRGL